MLLASPTVRMTPESEPPVLEWFNVSRYDKPAGKILAAFELIMARTPLLFCSSLLCNSHILLSTSPSLFSLTYTHIIAFIFHVYRLVLMVGLLNHFKLDLMILYRYQNTLHQRHVK